MRSDPNTTESSVDAARRYLLLAVRDGLDAVSDIRSLIPHAKLDGRVQLATETSLSTAEAALGNIGRGVREHP